MLCHDGAVKQTRARRLDSLLRPMHNPLASGIERLVTNYPVSYRVGLLLSICKITFAEMQNHHALCPHLVSGIWSNTAQIWRARVS
jgi:hypothetical protein